MTGASHVNRRWTEQQIADLVRLRQAGASLKECARVTGHTQCACEARYLDWIRGRKGPTLRLGPEKGRQQRKPGEPGGPHEVLADFPPEVLALAMSRRWA